MRTIRLAVLNVVMPTPHSSERYVALMEYTYGLRKTVTLRGRYKGMLGSVYRDGGVVRGQFYKFFDLDPSSDWFNISRKEQAEASEVRQIQIPEDLKPHLDRFDFVFFPQHHELVYAAQHRDGSLSPKLARDLLAVLFAEPSVIQEFGEVEVVAEPHKDRLPQILHMPGLKKLTIEVIAPNADDGADAERIVLRRMDKLGAKKEVIELTGRNNKQLALDPDLERKARVAQANGKVTGTAVDPDGRTVVMSTTEHPMVTPITYDQTTEEMSVAIERVGRGLVGKRTDRS